MAYTQKTIQITKVENGYLTSIGQKGYISHNDEDLKKIVSAGMEDLIKELNTVETKTEPVKE